MKTKRFTRNKYRGTRGREIKRDDVLEILLSKACEICQKSLERIRYDNGNLETLPRFEKRRTCSKECKKILLIGSGNPHYKGIMDIQCVICGKKNLAYVKTNEKKTTMCRPCWDSNRPDPYNRKEVKDLACEICKKSVPARYTNGRLRIINAHTFCSKQCANSRFKHERPTV